MTIGFVTGLLICKAYGQEYDAIFMIVDQLSKEKVYILCIEENKGTFAETIAELFFQNVWSKHGLPVSLTSNQGPQFVSKMWNFLCKLLEIKTKLSS